MQAFPNVGTDAFVCAIYVRPPFLSPEHVENVLAHRWPRKQILKKIMSAPNILINLLTALFEQIPLMLFLAARLYSLEMNERIQIAGAASLFVFYLWGFRKMLATPLYFGTNTFFVIAFIALLLPGESTAQFFTALGEVGMFMTIFACGLVWHFRSPHGLLKTRAAPSASKKYSMLLMMMYAICPAIAHHFKGNENLAGALPFILLISSEKILGFLQFRELTRGSNNEQ